MTGPDKTACPAVLRTGPQGAMRLAFAHLTAGLQIVKGTIKPDETAANAALRELSEQSGVAAQSATPFAQASTIRPGEDGHFFCCTARSGFDHLLAQWMQAPQGDAGGIYSFFWHTLAKSFGPQADPRFDRALDLTRRTAPP